MIDQDVRDKVAAARLMCVKRHPYVSSSLLAMSCFPLEGVGQVAADSKMRLAFDPEWVRDTSVEVVASALLHEVKHFIRRHADRVGVMDATKFNQAACLEINDDQVAAGWELPGGQLTPEALGMKNGLLAEEYYSKLPDPEPGPGRGGSGGEDGEGGDPEPSEDGGGSDPLDGGRPEPEGGRGGAQPGDGGDQRPPGDRQAGRGAGSPPEAQEPVEQPKQPQWGQGGPSRRPQGRQEPRSGGGAAANPGPSTPQPQLGGGHCGGCAGNPQDWESKADEMPEAPGGQSRADQEVIRHMTARDIESWAKSNGRGSVPGSLLVWAERELEEPTVPWYQKLAGSVRRGIYSISGANDFTYSKPSRRSMALNAACGRAPILPRLHRPVPDVRVVVDTSGSMMGVYLEQALAETKGVARGLGIPVIVYAVDATVQVVQRVFSGRDVQKLRKGFGGTDMRVGIAKAVEDGANVIVVLTDGYTPWPGPGQMPPGVRVIPCVIGDTPVPAHMERELIRINMAELAERRA